MSHFIFEIILFSSAPSSGGRDGGSAPAFSFAASSLYSRRNRSELVYGLSEYRLKVGIHLSCKFSIISLGFPVSSPLSRRRKPLCTAVSQRSHWLASFPEPLVLSCMRFFHLAMRSFFIARDALLSASLIASRALLRASRSGM